MVIYKKQRGVYFLKISKCILTALIVLSMIPATILGCSKNDEPSQPETTKAPSTSPPTTTSPPLPPPPPPNPEDPLTGIISERTDYSDAVVSVMINNLSVALPQAGIGSAGIIYECLTEGGISRLLAVFNNYKDIEMIGPVRSGRDYFIDLSYNHRAYYIHYGGSPQTFKKVEALGVKNLNGLSALDSVMFWRDKERLKKGSYMYEHSAFTSGEKIIKGLEYKKYETSDEAPISAFKFTQNEYTPKGSAAIHIKIPYSNYISPWYDYDPDTKQYLRSQFKGEHIDSITGEQLSFKNILVLYVEQWNVPGDTEGRIAVKTTGTGDGLYITNGQAIPIKYKKADEKTPAKYYLEDGATELTVNSGKTFVHLLSNKKKAEIS